MKKIRPLIEAGHSVEGELKETLKKISLSMSQITNQSYMRPILDILKTAERLIREKPGTLNLKIASSTLKELRYSFKLFYPKRMYKKITMFGSARVQSNTPLFEFACDFARQATKNHFLILTGGGPGIMEAGNLGAQENTDGNHGFGLSIRLPIEQKPNIYINKEHGLIEYKYFFTRKLFLVKEACAFLFFPGGYGTFDETFEVLTLLQTGKAGPMPVIFIEPPNYGFWKPWLKFMNSFLLEHGFISSKDNKLYTHIDSIDGAILHIKNFYSRYHSMRCIGNDTCVIRMQSSLSGEKVKKINEDFTDLLKDSRGKGFYLSGALEAEHNEPELKDLSRLVFDFNRKDYGRLRELIDYINL